MKKQIVLCAALYGCGARSQLNIETEVEVRQRELTAFQQRCNEAAQRVSGVDGIAGRYLGYLAETPFQFVNGVAVPWDPEPIYLPEGNEVSRIQAPPFAWSVCYLHHLRSPGRVSVAGDWGTCREVGYGLVDNPNLGFNIGGPLGPPGSAGVAFTVEAGSVDLRGDCLRYEATVRLVNAGPLTNDGVFIRFVGIRQR